MPLSWNEISSRALSFSKRWKDASDEEAQAQLFLNEFFNVFGVDLKRVATFEKKVPQGKNRNGYIDLLWKGVILIEMKSRGKSLDRAYTQARDYAFHLEDEELPEYIMVCDFENIRLYRDTTGQKWDIKTAQLHKNVKLFAELAGYKTTKASPADIKVDRKAAEKMARLHDILKEHGYEGHPLEVYLVRLLFCMFADDTGIFEKNIFFDYVNQSREDGSDLAGRLARLFEILDTPPEQRERQTLLSDELKRFAYINGKLFEERLPFADFDSSMRRMLFDCCSLDWGYISPAIFGAMFQGVMNPEERRELGAHYTSEENILKLIKPLFLDELWEEFERIKGSSKQLEQFHTKLSNLKFLDPACGCGNFLIITYRELRLLELEVLKMLTDHGQLVIDISSLCKVNVNQFYGIEREEFPCQIAQVGMWLIDHQMNTLFSEYFGLYFARLPLTQSATIVQGNALAIDWEEIVPRHELSYILGNPPFVGHQWRSKEQVNDIETVFSGYKKAGKLDYVCCWYKVAAEYIRNTKIQVAFVSTNSIVQGEQVAVLWKPLFDIGIEIKFAYHTFVWSNDASNKARVHCVIIGFEHGSKSIHKYIFENTSVSKVEHINGYLLAAPNVFIQSRGKPIIKGMPEMSKGSQPTDGGNLILSPDERNELIESYPQTEDWIKQYISSDDFINNRIRYCLWLKGIAPSEYRSIPPIMNRLKLVAECRLKSPTASVRQKSNIPMLFTEIRQPETQFLVVPEVSSERRRYIPIGYLEPHMIASNKLYIIPNATLYLFGVLMSSIHMSWTRVVCGRLKSDYSYSPAVYNNFPWPDPTDEQRAAIEQAAQGVLDARALYPDSSLADLYDPLSMPPELTKAHHALDKAVKAAYGGKGFATEAERVADLMQRYQRLVEAEK